jgi:ubiquinone/menaquinone biosynthesis C-methylase UbiE
MAEREKHAEVETHWGRLGVIERIDAALREAGFDPRNVTPEILGPLDQVHGGGIAMTKDQAEMVGFSASMKVLDIGCGIGGPARFLAETYGCQVWGIDLTAEWAAAGEVLTERCGLAEQVHIEQGNALDLTFDDENFDVAWCQNVMMNIADKPTLLAQVHRVLRPGGKFSLAEYCQGEGGDIHYPVVWADSPEINFLVNGDEMINLLKAAGFRLIKSRDLTKILGERPQPSTDQSASKPETVLGVHIVLGRTPEDIAERRRQITRNIAEARLTYQITVAERI